jgi:hypothetical protein
MPHRPDEAIMSKRASPNQRSTSPTSNDALQPQLTSQVTPSGQEAAHAPDAEPPEDTFWAFSALSRRQSRATAPQPTTPQQQPSIGVSAQTSLSGRPTRPPIPHGRRPTELRNMRIQAQHGTLRGLAAQLSSPSSTAPHHRPLAPPFLGILTAPIELSPFSPRPPDRMPLDHDNSTFLRGYNAGFEAGKDVGKAEAGQTHTAVVAHHQLCKDVLRKIYAARVDMDIEKMDAWIVRGWDEVVGKRGSEEGE